MDTLLDVQLTQAQRELLEAIALPWFDTGQANYATPYIYGTRPPKGLPKGEWPLWGHIQHHFDKQGRDAEELFHSLPRVGNSAPFASGYGLTAPMRRPIGEGERVRLTIAASLWITPWRTKFCEPFLRVLHHMIKLYLDRPITSEITTVMLRSGELMAAMPDLEPGFVEALPELLSYEPLISTGGAQLGDGSWERQITRSVMQFRDAKTLEDYITQTCETVAKAASQYVPATVAEGPPLPAEPARGPYVDPGLLKDLDEAAKTTRWRVHKLIALCEGLNDAYAAGNPYVCGAMIRAILDHIPPLFGHTDFKVVASQHVFTVKRTDKSHAQKLAAFKDIADDVMHRPIGPSVPRISMDDIPEPVRLNAVLQEVVAILR
ncbi:hypothetical protein [Streptomyces sp. NPDC050121]|uniref:hypothetical protein n=1 Tax=Streptomyces sp. NPDC050121 TaxID=3365601 RepID=UPI0037B854F9